jgi:hypothetical protein
LLELLATVNVNPGVMFCPAAAIANPNAATPTNARSPPDQHLPVRPSAMLPPDRRAPPLLAARHLPIAGRDEKIHNRVMVFLTYRRGRRGSDRWEPA